MKTTILILLLLSVVIGGTVWHFKSTAQTSAAPPLAAPMKTERKILYYQSAMHPWIKSDKPGKCPICGMNLVPVYETDATATNRPDMVLFDANTLSVVNVQTETVQRRPVVHTLNVTGTIRKNSSSAAWFVFIVYERDLPWIQPGQTLDVSLPAFPGKVYPAQIKQYGTETFADRDLDEASDSTLIRAQITHPPVTVPGFEGKAFFNNLQAAAQIHAATPEVLTVPRTAVISRGTGPLVYVENSTGHYTPQSVVLGRAGDDCYEVLSGLVGGEKVVTHGSLLMDAEAQLSSGR